MLVLTLRKHVGLAFGLVKRRHRWLRHYRPGVGENTWCDQHNPGAYRGKIGTVEVGHPNAHGDANQLLIGCSCCAGSTNIDTVIGDHQL